MTALEKALLYLCVVQWALLTIAFLWVMVLRRGVVTTATFIIKPSDNEPPTTAKNADVSPGESSR